MIGMKYTEHVYLSWDVIKQVYYAYFRKYSVDVFVFLLFLYYWIDISLVLYILIKVWKPDCRKTSASETMDKLQTLINYFVLVFFLSLGK